MNKFNTISDREFELINNYNYILCNCIKINNNLDIRLYKKVNSNKDIIVLNNLLHNEVVCLYKETFNKVNNNYIDLFFPKIKNKKVFKKIKVDNKQKTK
jgi:hypothetical protein